MAQLVCRDSKNKKATQKHWYENEFSESEPVQIIAEVPKYSFIVNALKASYLKLFQRIVNLSFEKRCKYIDHNTREIFLKYLRPQFL